VPLGFLGLPSLHGIIEGIANGFFGALADALVPGFLKRGTVATIQHLVALPDPGAWTHVGQLQGDMVYLAAMLLPVTLAVGTLRYWFVGFTGQAHPVLAVGRCTWVTGVLVGYRWIVDETVAATNTLTHAILGFPTVGNGLQRIIGVLFGGALLTGTGGVFGAFLMIIGVLFAAGLFAAQVLLTVVLALLIVAGPPLIALSAIPELSHLARTWAHALLATALVPLGWTVLFATAGALCLDATSFTGGAGGLPGHVAAAFAGLITFVLAVKLPLMLLGEMRHLFGAASLSRRGERTAGSTPAPGVARVTAAHARLRSAAFQGAPSLGRSVGRAAGAMGAPAGGPLGAARRGLAATAYRAGIPGAAAGLAVPGGASGPGGAASEDRAGVGERLADAGRILASAPREAKAAMAGGAREVTRAPVGAASPRAGEPRSRNGEKDRAAAQPPASAGAREPRAAPRPDVTRPPGQPHPPRPASPGTTPKPAPRTPAPSPSSPAGSPPAAARRQDGSHPGRKVTTSAGREAAMPAREAAKPPAVRRASRTSTPQPPQPNAPTQPRVPVSRKPRPGRES